MRTPFVMPERREVFPGVMGEKLLWGWTYRGKRDALIAAGIVEADCFPGEPGQLKTVAHGLKDGRKIIVRQNGARHTFNACVRFKKDELAKERTRQALREARAKETRELARVPLSHDDFRAGLKVRLCDLLEYARAAALGATALSGGYRYSQEAIEAFDEAALDLIKTLLSGRIVFDAKVRAREFAKIKGNSAKSDLALQRFLENVNQSTAPMAASRGL